MSLADDTSIIAVLTRYPDLSDQEIDQHINNIQDSENVEIGKAIVGRISPADLSDSAKMLYEEITRWSGDKTSRFRNDQVHSRRIEGPTREAQRMISLRDQGIISDTFLVLYGIQGDLPEYESYALLNDAEKRQIWVRRLEARFGINWRESVGTPRLFFWDEVEKDIDWKMEGF